MVQNLTVTELIVAHTCGECSIIFGVPDGFLEERRRDGRTFYCPNGHPRAYRETEEQRLRKELERTRRQRSDAYATSTALRDQLDATERSRRALRGVITRTKNRVAAGNCPMDSCGRHFADLGEHIRTDHADLLEDA